MLLEVIMFILTALFCGGLLFYLMTDWGEGKTMMGWILFSFIFSYAVIFWIYEWIRKK